MNNQNQTNNSLFTDIELDEAANVNGGFSTYSSYFFFLNNLNRYGRSNYPGYGTVRRGRNGLLYLSRR